MLEGWGVWVVGLVSTAGLLAAVELGLSFLHSTALDGGSE
jgi:hypothetical protein